jgi:hypothetical protein
VDIRLSDEKIKTDYMFKLNYFRYNLAHAEESKMLPPPILEKLEINY